VRFELGDEGEVITAEINIKLENSLLLSECKCDKKVENLYSFMSDLKSFLHSFIDVLGYELGCAYDLDIITCFDHQNIPFNFWGGSLRCICSPENRPHKSKEIVEKLYGNGDYFNTLQLCFANLREAIRFPHDTPFFCYRAVENIRQYFVQQYSLDGKNNTNKSWKKMWESINLDYEDYFRKLQKNISAKVRHGDIITMSCIERSEILEKTYTVIDKFIVYAFAEMKRQEDNSAHDK